MLRIRPGGNEKAGGKDPGKEKMMSIKNYTEKILKSLKGMLLI